MDSTVSADLFPGSLVANRTVAVGEDRFIVDESPCTSRRGKHLYSGLYVHETHTVPAYCTFHETEAGWSTRSFVEETMSALGLGPLPLGSCKAYEPMLSEWAPSEYVATVAENVGVALSDLLAGKQELIPDLYEGGGVAFDNACDEQVAKILFDVSSDIARLHTAGWRHLDVKTSNICVQAYGPNKNDVRATLIDFESAAFGDKALPRLATQTYWRKRESLCASYSAPESLTNDAVDLIFLTLVAAQLCSGTADVSDLTVEQLESAAARGFSFGLPWEWILYPISQQKLDLLAAAAGLERPSSAVERLLGAIAQHSGYVDELDRRRYRSNPQLIIEERVMDLALALHSRYNETKATTERDDFFEFLEQPEIKIRQGMRQARDAYRHLKLCGYEVIRKDEARHALPVSELQDAVVERLAELEHDSWMEMHSLAGYAYSPKRDDEKKLNDFMLPWAKLPIGDRKYDLDYARSLPQVFASIGLVIVRSGTPTKYILSGRD